MGLGWITLGYIGLYWVILGIYWVIQYVVWMKVCDIVRQYTYQNLIFSIKKFAFSKMQYRLKHGNIKGKMRVKCADKTKECVMHPPLGSYLMANILRFYIQYVENVNWWIAKMVYP